MISSRHEILGNHLALLREGQARGGPTVRMILDSKGDEIPINGGDQMVKITLDGVDYEVDSKSTAQAIKKELDKMQAKIDSAMSEKDELQGQLDACKAEKDSLQEKLIDATDPEKITKRADDRASLIADARSLSTDLDVSGTDHEIRVRALEAVGVTLSLDSEHYVLARFDAALENLKSKKSDSVTKAREIFAPTNNQKMSYPGVSLDRR